MKKDPISTIGKKIRSAEKEMTKGIIKWKLKQQGQPQPDESTLEAGSEKIVDEAHRIVKKTGKGFFDNLKQAKKEFLKAYKDEDKE